MFKWILFFGVGVLGFFSCHRPFWVKPKETDWEKILTSLDSVPGDMKKYHPADTIFWRLFHADVHLQWDYALKNIKGKAYIFLTPHAYPRNKVVLDALGMEFKGIHVYKWNGTSIWDFNQNINREFHTEHEVPFESEYSDSMHLTLSFFKKIVKDTLVIALDYIAYPGKIKSPHAAAITDTKGWYFINADKQNPYSPREIWTQGEVQSNSSWIPIIDKPNQKLTHRISLLHDTSEVTLSNGIRVHSKKDGAGMVTDVWEMRHAHAPYLMFVGAGPFQTTTTNWRDSIPLTSYLEPLYAPYHSKIFKNTGAILECFSQKLGFDYPWPALSQMVGRDYVSGAMENTTAILYGSFVQKLPEELVDYPNDIIQAHEIFHHWFGDWVTCKAWSQIGLNESFATYGEYIWMECKYGKPTADYYLNEVTLQGYLFSLEREGISPIVRHRYGIPDELFDRTSYNKGGLVLHMLRQKLGDDIFFMSLRNYLIQFGGKTAEWHDLRRVMEEVSGMDLYSFFQQWIFEGEIPEVSFIGKYDEMNKKYILDVYQNQVSKNGEVFKLAFDVDFYDSTGRMVRFENCQIDSFIQSLTFHVDFKPAVVNPDPTKTLLWLKKIEKEPKEWQDQFVFAQNYVDKAEAVQGLLEKSSEEIEYQKYFFKVAHLALQDTFHATQRLGFEMIKALEQESAQRVFIPDLIQIIKTSTLPVNRAKALQWLIYLDAKYALPYCKIGIQDSSLAVCEASLMGLKMEDSLMALNYAKLMMTKEHPEYVRIACTVCGNCLQDDYSEVFKKFLQSGDPSWFTRNLSSWAVLTGNAKNQTEFQKYLTIAIDAFNILVQANSKLAYIFNRNVGEAYTIIQSKQEKAFSEGERLMYAKRAGMLRSAFPDLIQE